MRDRSSKSIAAMTVTERVPHLLERYHDPHRRELPERVALSRKVERVHRDVPEAPLGLGNVLERMSVDPDLHMALEEKLLFPAMLRDVKEGVRHPLEVMRGELAGLCASLREQMRIENEVLFLRFELRETHSSGAHG